MIAPNLYGKSGSIGLIALAAGIVGGFIYNAVEGRRLAKRLEKSMTRAEAMSARANRVAEQVARQNQEATDSSQKPKSNDTAQSFEKVFEIMRNIRDQQAPCMTEAHSVEDVGNS